MTDLTEQWKSGELEQGWYYINSGDIDYKYSKYNSADFFVTPHEDIKKVLAPVPSYGEWQASYNCMLENEVLRLKNTQLKELLKEWAQFETEENPNDFTVISERMSGLANKTKQAIGEMNNGD